jgi:hypothetical protein
LNLIVYLNPEWDESWGGNFDLHSNPWEPEKDHIRTILPLFNHGVIFETNEHSWHGFEPIRLPENHKGTSRRSFAIYLYTRERATDETAASHATVYVPRPIPETVRAGEVLEDHDYQLVKQRFGLARTMLQFLYQREQRFNRQIDVLRRALDEARGSQRLDLQGYAVQPTAPTGLWPDSWASPELTFAFIPSKPVRALALDVMAPSKLESQVLEIAAGDWSGSEELQPGERRTLRIPIDADARERVKVEVRASASWCGKEQGVSEDDRRLAFRVLSAVIDHEPR